MSFSKNIIILSFPRSGSSLMANLIASAGYKHYISERSELMGGSEFNPDGYFEDTLITLLNDQLIRFYFGKKCSFLYLPKINNKPPNNPLLWNYDIDETTLFLPKDYEKNIKQYTGHDWDVWGLTRMVEGQKWFRCYSRLGVQDFFGIFKQKKIFEDKFNSSTNLVLKDPRLSLTLPFYNLKNYRIIYIKRDKDDILSSMRKHYGPNLFNGIFLPKSQYCSNHFNYKIEYQDFDEYCEIFSSNITYALSTKNHLTVNYNKILSKDEDTIDMINNFIHGEININLIK